MQRSNFRGHKIVWRNERWVYEDTGEPVPEKWKERPCGHCNREQTEEGHDGCLGTLPGIMNACCGHGIKREAYVQFLDGATVRGESAVTILGELAKHRVT